MLPLTSLAPAFSLPDQHGKIHNLSDYRGKWLILYFYPKDDTPGCTKEACNFQNSYPILASRGVTILGISADSVESHLHFSSKYNLTFPLLSDPDKSVIKAYEAWAPKVVFGKEILGIQRISYLINPEGKIDQVYTNVNPATHSGEILNDLNKYLL